MQHPSLASFVVAATLLTGCAGAIAGEADCSFPTVDADALDRVQECVRMGRHVRVGPSVSQGTATLGSGAVSAAAERDTDGGHRRVRVTGPGAMPPGFFAQ